MSGRYLLIKPWGYGLWSDMHDVWGKLLLAELTNRRPIVYWGTDSLYSVHPSINSFEQYFFPVSDCSVGEVVSPHHTYYPPIWNFYNVLQPDPNKHSYTYRDMASFINCNASVLVSDVYHFAHELIPWIPRGHPAYGLNEDDLYRYIINKYIRLLPDIANEIEAFYKTHMRTGPIIAVHIRAGSKLEEDPRWREVNAQYPHEINRYLQANPSARIFLLTDDEAVLRQYIQMYGNILIYTDCSRRASHDTELCLKAFPDPRRKGVEILKDTYLACKCDYFVGNYWSNVARAVIQLRFWANGTYKLLYRPD